MKLKAVSGIMLTLLFIGILTLTFKIQPVKAEPTTWTVDDDRVECPDADFTRIQDAIDAASPRDTIYVYNGTYYGKFYERINIDKSLTFIGENKNNTFIFRGIEISVNNVNVTGFTIYSSVQFEGERNIGVLVLSSGNNISYNIIKDNNAVGICLDYRSSNNTLIGNIVSNNGVGIELNESCNNTLISNTISNNTESNFSVWGEDSSHFNNYIDMSNTVDGKPICYLIGASDAVYDAQTNVGTIYLINSKNITIRDIILTKNGHGVLLWNTTNSKIQDITASKNEFGICLYNGCNNIIIIGNNISFNKEWGIDLWNPPLASSNNNVIAGNGVSSNGVGIGLSDFCNNNTIVSNTISLNNDTGIWLEYSSNNTIYHNNFINNARAPWAEKYQAGSYSSWNIWDNGYPSGGNYWSDYTGDDSYRGPYQNETGSDAIGDTPYAIYEEYAIDENNQDNYPLISPWEDVSPPDIEILSPENKTYTTSSVSLSFTVGEVTSWIAYSLDGQANVTITGNTILSGLSDRSHSLIVYAKDTVGNTGTSEIIYFTIETRKEDAFPTWIVAPIVIIAVVGAALLVYFAKVKKTTEKVK